jgi:hypothetical protein
VPLTRTLGIDHMYASFLRLGVFVGTLKFVAVCSAAVLPSPQVAIVAKLYQDFAFEAVLEEPNSENALFIEQPRKVLLHYFTPKLADLLLRDRRCVTATHEICRLDFAPLWGNQDPIGVGVQVLPGATSDTVNVRLRYPSSTSQLTYHLTKTSAGWRVRDISYGQGRSSLAEILESKP